MRSDYAHDPLLDRGPTLRRVTEFLPVIKLTANDDVVDRCKRPLRVIQMTVQHAAGL